MGIRQICAAGVIGGIGIGALFYYQWLNVAPTATIPLPVLPSPNGYNALIAAADIQKQKDAVTDAYKSVTFKDQHVYSLSEKDALAAANAPALAATREALKLPYWNPADRSSTTPFSEFAKFRSLARLMTLESQVKAAHGDNAGALNSLLDVVQLGLAVPRGGVLIAGLVGIACESIGDRPMWRLIDNLDAASAASGARRMEDLTARRFPFSKTLKEEKWFGESVMLNELQHLSTLQLIKQHTADDRNLDMNGDEEVSSHELSTVQKAAILKSLLTHSKRRIFADYVASMDLSAAQADLPYSPATPDSPIPDDPINQALFPVFKAARFKDAQVRMQSSLLTCSLALRAYKVSHSDYPASLADLVSAGLLTRVPDDPFANTAGTPFRYRRLTSDEYLLYSVGPDGIDDGGKPVDLAKSKNPSRYYPLQDDKGDWVVGVDAGNPIEPVPTVSKK